MSPLAAVDAESLLEQVEEVVLAFDESGALVSWNRATEDVTGRDGEALSGLPASEFLGEGNGVAAAFDGSFDGDRTVETALDTAEGKAAPYEFTLYSLGGESEAAVAAVGREDESRAAPEHRNALNRMSDAFFAVDEDWRVTYVNRAGRGFLADAMGIDPERDEVVGRELWSEIPDAVDTVFYEHYHEAMATQEPATFEEYYEPLDTWFDVRVYPSETGLSVYFYDASDRRRQRETLKRREEVLRRMHDVIADRDRPFSEQVEALLALGREELGAKYGTLSRIQGETYTFEVVDAADGEIQAGDVVPTAATNCETVASTEQTVVLGDVARDAPEATERAGYAEWGISCYIGAPVYLDDSVYGTFCFYDTEPREGEFSEWEITLVDLMSRWVTYELQRQRANERLQEQNERMEQFASMVSHDLRNPLNVLDGYLELAAETGEAEHFERCESAVARMNQLIEDLLTLARAGEEATEPEPVALGPFVEESWETVATGDSVLRVETERTVMADRTRLRQLLENLVRNAVEHGSADRRPLTITVGDLDDGFYVEDDGVGIPPEAREQVFESGYSSTDAGTGFGLAIVEDIAAGHGWEVRITESEAGGARFEFRGVA